MFVPPLKPAEMSAFTFWKKTQDTDFQLLLFKKKRPIFGLSRILFFKIFYNGEINQYAHPYSYSIHQNIYGVIGVTK